MSEEQTIILETRKLYIDDLSVEVPHAPGIFQEELNPEISFNINFENEKLPPEHYYQVRIRVTVTAKDGERTIYLVEASQCGIFEIAGLDDLQLRHALNVYCTTQLYPYVTEIISSTIVRAGFPSLFLQPINFEGLFQQRLMQEAEEQKNAPASPEDAN